MCFYSESYMKDEEEEGEKKREEEEAMVKHEEDKKKIDMDFSGMSGYRQPPPDPQSIPPPNFPPRGMPRDQGMSGNPIFNRPMMPRLPPGYPPMGDPHMPPGFPPIPGQEQGLPMGYQSSSSMQNPGLPPAYQNPLGGHPMTNRPPQNIQQGFHHNPNQALAQQSFHPQQHPPQHNHHQRGSFQNLPPHQHIPNDFNPNFHHQQTSQHRPQPPTHRQQHPNSMMNHQFHPQQQQGPNPSDFHPHQQHNAMGPGATQPEFHSMHTNSIVNEYHHPHQQMHHHHHQQQHRPDFSQQHHQDAHQAMSHHDFRHHQGGREQQQGNMMGVGPFMDHQSMVGLQGMMNEHMMGQAMEDHLLGGGDAYSQAHMMHMYADPNMSELGEGDFIATGMQLMDKAMNSSITCVNFDKEQELMWAGNQRGYVASYYGLGMDKYTAFRIHLDEDIRMNLSYQRGILSLTPNLLRGSLRRGLSTFNFTHEHLHDMQCMMLKNENAVLIGGYQTNVLEFDLNQQCLSSVYEIKDTGVAIFRKSDRFICGGDSTGKVTIYDSKTLRAEHHLDAHSSCLSDFDIHDNLLITCGFSPRGIGLAPDRLLMVYDMRVMRAMAPIQVSCEPTFLRFLPTIPNHLVVVSQNGHFQLVETITGSGMNSTLSYPVDTQGSLIVAFDVSDTYQALAFGDSSGHVHLYSNGPTTIFNAYSEPTEFPDQAEALEPISIDEQLAAYSGIPMPYPGHGTLVSDFPEEMMARTYRKPLPIDSETMRTMKVYQNIGYAPNTNKQKRNVIPYDLSDKNNKDGKSGVPESPIGRGDDPFMIVPKRYRRVDIKYSKFGVEDFDFRHYNKTNLAGLEPHIPNAYCNSMLQVLYFIEPLRCALLGHVCEKEFCLSCELGFLFHMLDSQKGNTCQASNFLRAFRTMPQVSALGLVLHDIDENSGKVDFLRLIQSWQRFVLMQIHKETSVPVEQESSSGTKNSKDCDASDDSKKGKKKKGKSENQDLAKKQNPGEGAQEEENKTENDSCKDSAEEPEEPMERSIIRDLFGINIKSSLQCKCGLSRERNVDGTHINLMYPECRPMGPQAEPLFISFAEVVQHSMTASTNTQAWCPTCNRYQHHCQRKSIQNLPDIVAFNCHTENGKNLDFWKTQFEIVRQRHKETSVPAAVIRPSTSNIKCRFGNSCHRPNCHFLHDGPREHVTPPKRKEPEEDDEFGPSWIPMGLKIVRNPDGSVDVTEISDEEPLPYKEEEDVRYYELYSIVSHVLDNTGGNLVACLKVGEKYHQRKERVTCTQWYLLNDFCITPVEKDEAVDFKLNWNVPCIIHYTRRNFVPLHDLTIKNWSSPDILFTDLALLNPERVKITFMPLQEGELPSKGDLVALDAEFVSLKEEEAELRSDGTRSTIIPSQMSVARITCIRGSGPHQGEPFLDDYICTQEQVVDYLTQYSGIKPGDLDPAVSTKHLTTLKSTYLKLRYLVDAGVVFVGHGLKKDFRVINVLVPKAQVMDTVELYHLPRQRYISLKFLAWYFLKINIQSYTHDSIEDAYTAFQLYQEHLKLKESGQDKVISIIKELYEAGRKIGWKIPDIAEEDISEEAADFL
ncbi:PAB-dependent poly(A)-specific ribonuclease subunit PAN2 [Elysia marginata]|uniref:PAN2-PAN3 deadenylation complex catalytic subunit PAN2 n=1 Tax=Elysia marginata TaxID=1093978 RepID=A0AAV4HAY6_9GAST|nr:PAB-dependent poly(A)-specific ribonuclease subunit PAN2 [Elysia marginata]